MSQPGLTCAVHSPQTILSTLMARSPKAEASELRYCDAPPILPYPWYLHVPANPNCNSNPWQVQCNMESLAQGSSPAGKMWLEGQAFMRFFQAIVRVRRACLDAMLRNHYMRCPEI